jgi:hypothetical protein
MLITLTPGEAVHIGDAVTLTVLAVEGDLIRFALEAPEGGSPGAGNLALGGEQTDPRHKRNCWELN